MSSRAVTFLAAAIASTALGVFAPAAMAIPNLDDVKDTLDDVKDKVDDITDDVEDTVDEAKKEAERAVGEITPDLPEVPALPSVPSPSTESPRDSSDGGSDDRGSSGSESDSRRPSRGRGRSGGGRRSSNPPAPSAPVAPAPAPDAVVSPPLGQPFDALSAEAAREKPEDLLGPGVAGPVRNVPRGVLVKRPAAAQTDRLRRRLARAEGCLGNGLQARALGLRSEGRSWAGVGSRLGISSQRALGLGRLGLARLSTLSGGCGAGGGGSAAGPVAFSQRFGADGIGAVAMLGMGSGSGAGAAGAGSGSGSGGGAPAVAGAPGGSGGGGDVLGDSAPRAEAVPEDGQSSYVGAPPAPPGSTLALEPGTAASSGDGNGQGAEVAQALGLLALALLLILALRYRLRPSPAAAAGGSSRFRRGSGRRPEQEVAEVATPVGAVAHAGTEDEHGRWADDGEGFEPSAYAGAPAGYAGDSGGGPDAYNGKGPDAYNGRGPDAYNGSGAAQNGHGGVREELVEPSGRHANENGRSAAATPAQPLDAEPLHAEPLDAQPLDAEPPHAEPAPPEADGSEAVILGEPAAAAGDGPAETVTSPALGTAPQPEAAPHLEATPNPPVAPHPALVASENGAGGSGSGTVQPEHQAAPSASAPSAGGQPAWHERPRARRVKRLFSSRDS